jgi:O-antigen/teichoic acid export membrane protein
MGPGTEVARRTARFAVPSLLSALAAFVLLPVVARHVTAAEWAGLAIGQSVGTVAGVIGNLGWTLNGPSLVARASSHRRVAVYAESLRSRLVVTTVALAMAVAITLLLTRQSMSRDIALAASVAATLGGLTPRWYNVGAGRAGDIVRYEVAPMLGASALALVAILRGADPVIYPVAQVFAVAIGVAAFTRVVRQGSGAAQELRPLGEIFRAQWSPAVTEFGGAAYSAANPALVSAQLTLASVATYTSGFRLYQWLLLPLVIVSQALQGWVSSRGGTWHARATYALRVHVVVGLGGGFLLALAGRGLSGLAFGDQLRVPDDVAAWLGVAFFFVSVNTSLGRHVLAARGRVDLVLRSTVAGALLGVPLIVVLAQANGAPGAAMALAASEAVVCLIQGPSALRLFSMPGD